MPDIVVKSKTLVALRGLGFLWERKFWGQVHLWLGLGVGMIMALIGITGAILVFHHEIDHAINPEFFYMATVPSHAQVRSLEELGAAAIKAAPSGWKAQSLDIPERPDENYIFNFDFLGRPNSEHAIMLRVAVNPYTAEAVGRRIVYNENPFKNSFIGFIFKLHYEFVSGPTGMFVIGIIALFLIVSVVTGLVLWWPTDGKWRRVLTIKRNASTVRFNHDLHQVAGIYTAIIVLMLLVTGIYFNLPDQFRWVVERFSPIQPVVEQVHLRNRGATPITLDEALARARQQYPTGRLETLALRPRAQGVFDACFKGVPELKSHVIDTRCLSIDHSNGAVLQVVDPENGSGGDLFLQWQWPLHSGTAFGWTGRIIVMLAGLCCPVIFVTGVIRWLHKRDAKKRAQVKRSKSPRSAVAA